MACKNIMVTFHLPPLLADTLELLLENKFIVDEQIAVLHTKAMPDKAPVRMTLYRLRQALKPYKIEVYNDRHAGYWVSREDKEKIRAMLKEDVSLHWVGPKVSGPSIEDVPERRMPEEPTSETVQLELLKT